MSEGVLRYREIQRREPRHAVAAQFTSWYHSAGPILEVARMRDSRARVAFVTGNGFDVILVKTIDDHGRPDWKVVERQEFLVYSEGFDLLYTTDAKAFAKEYEPIS